MDAANISAKSLGQNRRSTEGINYFFRRIHPAVPRGTRRLRYSQFLVKRLLR
jgi:hypothetical protein